MRVFYLRDRNQFPVACVASEKVTKGEETVVNFSLSALNPKDVKDFEKKRGRDIAEGRLVAGKIFGTVPMCKLIKSVIVEMIYEQSKSEVARAAALHWLMSRREA